MRTFDLSAERTLRGWWVLERTEGAVSQVCRLDQAEEEIREAIACLAGLDQSEVGIEIKQVLPTDFYRHSKVT